MIGIVESWLYEILFTISVILIVVSYALIVRHIILWKKGKIVRRDPWHRIKAIYLLFDVLAIAGGLLFVIFDSIYGWVLMFITGIIGVIGGTILLVMEKREKRKSS